MDKGWLTNYVSLGVVAASYTLDGTVGSVLRSAGLFALSGAITNQLAIHMLFEKVPFLYGSGIILDRFESIREALKVLIMEQFFTPEKIENFVQMQEKSIDLSPIIEQTDFTPAYEALVKSVMESPMGGMIGMFGGEAIIGKLKEPFLEKIKISTVEIAQSESFNNALNERLHQGSGDLVSTIESIVESRLAELTPVMVKEMLHSLMKEHLGWLVVWGGVFGGLIGLLGAFLI
ncbi:MAG: DUF445 domain-containing protein [Sulfuricurvum sp. PD_MW2]|jgi:uncharacterized membrane protein YheB (UPF0754 family)|uniref:DUF445 domain-containing protein n=1 Tax=Sulfuricurvum sp. PD_MW2 TaxID=2027917 RepID=UPI000C06466B|nr:DUF445 domain-containing protein [Sulfuricurvum sp. PD_MW2]PHM18416.1 MAG: DUF445 domain-containing protein [Sulfuricurvum sp. PD_MW2]